MFEYIANVIDREDEELLHCPLCGSQLFLSSRSISRSVFYIRAAKDPQILVIKDNIQESEEIDLGKFFCGACSWQGNTEQLVTPVG